MDGNYCDKWIRFRRNSTTDNFFQRAIHPLIQAEFDTAKAQVHAKTTLYEACAHIAKHDGWGYRQEAVMKVATVKDFEETIKGLTTEDLKVFMRQLLEICIQRQNYVSHFGSATDHFIDACRNICADPQSTRLGKLIRLLFKDANLTSQLESKPVTTVPVEMATPGIGAATSPGA